MEKPFRQQKVQALEKTIRNTGNILCAIGMGMLLVLMLLGAGDVIGRYLFNKPVTGTMEVSSILLAGIVFFGWAYTQAVGGHVKVEIFFSRFPPLVQTAVSLLTLFISLILFSLITWQGARMAMIYWKAGRLIDVIYVPIAPFQLFVSLGALVLCLELAIQLLHLLPQVRKAG
jgi:TRAP-type C4-dicarboxylate transport system permease small subunit